MGRPMGRRRMAGVASAVPPEPPAEISPPMSRREPMKRSKASAMAATAAPRSPLKTAVAPLGWNRATSAGPISAGEGFWLVLRSTVTVPQAQLLQAIADEGELAALGVEGAGDIGGAADELGDGHRHRGRRPIRHGLGLGRRHSRGLDCRARATAGDCPGTRGWARGPPARRAAGAAERPRPPRRRRGGPGRRSSPAPRASSSTVGASTSSSRVRTPSRRCCSSMVVGELMGRHLAQRRGH